MLKKAMILVAVGMLLPAATAMAFHPNEDCDRCHIPHESGDSNVVPLWSGTATATVVFTEYSSPTMDAAPGDPEGSTLLCLACHDGASSHSIVPDAAEDGDLSGTHPMHFVYNTALANADGELVDPAEAGSSTVVGGKGTISEDLLVAGVMNCVSCHEIHVNGLHEGTGGVSGEFDYDIPHLVNIPGIEFELGHGGVPGDPEDWELSYGALCTTCHVK